VRKILGGEDTRKINRVGEKYHALREKGQKEKKSPNLGSESIISVNLRGKLGDRGNR